MKVSLSLPGAHVLFDGRFASILDIARLADRNVERVAQLADGWMAPPYTTQVIAEEVRKIKAAVPQCGRDPNTMPIYAILMPVAKPDGRPDIDAVFAMAEEFVAAGVTELETMIMGNRLYKDDVEPLIDRPVALCERRA